MTVIHADLTGERAVIPRDEFDRLVELAGQSEAIEVHTAPDELPTEGLMKLAELGGSFDWLADEDDLYSLADLKMRYR